ncbi:MAG TPA: carboxypeptidase-like regulatory domain-containing protein [Planctomycetota bacterium]
MLALALLSACGPGDSAPRPSAPATLVVLDGLDDRPLAGVRIAARDGTPLGETDASGACELPATEEQDRAWFHLEKPGFGHGVAHSRWATVMEVVLVPLVTLHGRVLAADSGEAVPGARVSLPRMQCSCPVAETRADAAGRYELAVDPFDLQLSSLSVDAPGFAPSKPRPRLESAHWMPRQLDLEIQRGVELAGRAVDLETGRGLLAEVAGHPTAQDGSFTLRVLPERGFAELVVRAEGHCALYASIPEAELARAEPWRFPLARGTALEGVVRDEAGRGLVGIEVNLYGHALAPEARTLEESERARELAALPPGWRLELDSRAPWEPPSTTTDAGGRFRFEGLPPWSRSLRLSAHDGAFRGCEQEIGPLAGPGAATRVELALGSERYPERAEITGRIRVNGFEGELPGELAWKGRTRAGRASTRGALRLAVESGEVALRVALDDFPAPTSGNEVVLVHRGGFLERDLDVRVPARPIQGRVRFEDGPAVRVRVSARGQSPRSVGEAPRWLAADVRTDSEGRFRFDAPDLGQPYEVTVHVGEGGRVLEVWPGDDELDIELRRPAVLALRATEAASGRALTPREVHFWWKVAGSAELRHVQLDWAPVDEGWHRVLVPNGALELEVWPAPDSMLMPARGRHVLAQPGSEPTEVAIALQPGLALHLGLDPSSGPFPLGHALLLLEEADRDAVRTPLRDLDGCGPRCPYEVVSTQPFLMRELRLDTTGTAVVHGLEPGRYVLRAFPADLVLEPETIQLEASTTAPVLVRWQKAR